MSQNRLQPSMGIAIFCEENNPFIVPFSIGFQMGIEPVHHFIFNIGGNILLYLGEGNGCDLMFWIFTIVAGIICAIHTIIRVYKVDHPKDDDYRYA